MSRGTYLTNVEKGKILAFLENELSFREIGRKLGRSDRVEEILLKTKVSMAKIRPEAQKESYPKKIDAELLKPQAILIFRRFLPIVA